MKKIILLLLLPLVSTAQLQPGFDANEYSELLKISVRTADSAYSGDIPEPEHFYMNYQSEPVGLDNRWDLWIDEDRKIAVVSIRGSTAKAESWMLNFYAAMIPARGDMAWMVGDERRSIHYNFSDDPKAAVHAGWALGACMMQYDILEKMSTANNLMGIEDFIVVGHSQGGAISYLITANLLSMQEAGVIPAEWKIKTYSSAAPKPGNLFFARSYEAATQNGWAFNVINAADWVPEVPISIQTLDDFNTTNPFLLLDDIMEQQSLLDRIGLWWVLRQLDKPVRTAQENYEKLLGERIGKNVTDSISGLEMPEFYHSNHYVRTGIQITMHPDSAYYEQFQDSDTNVFVHHMIEPYLYLTDELEEPFYKPNNLVGIQWEATSWRGPDGDMIDQYPTLPHPFLLFTTNGKVIGHIPEGQCRYFDISYIVTDKGLTIYRDLNTFGEDCDGRDEFIRALRNSNRLERSGNTLRLFSGSTMMIELKMADSEE